MKKLLLQAGLAIVSGATVMSASVATPVEVTNENIVETYNYTQVHEINVNDVYTINGIEVSYEEWISYKDSLESGTALPAINAVKTVEANLSPQIESDSEEETQDNVQVYLYGTMSNAKLLPEYQFSKTETGYFLETSLKKDDFFLITDTSTYYGANHLKEEHNFIKADEYDRIVIQVDGTYQISFDGETIDVKLKGMDFLDNIVFAESENFYNLITTEGTHFDYLAVYNRGETAANSYNSSVCGVYQEVEYQNKPFYFQWKILFL